jgi:hypothetical protein
MTNLIEAHMQWLTRPPDERFRDLESLYAFTQTRRQFSRDEIHNLADVHLAVTSDGAIALNGDAPPAPLTHWAFGQLATTVGAPSRYLRGLTPELVCECIMHGLKRSVGRCKVMLQLQPNGSANVPHQRVAAFTGPTYGRIWDADVVEQLMEAIQGTGWRVPPAYANDKSKGAGLYASDRDMFAFFVNDEKPLEIGNAKLGKGFFLWNSETGAASFGLTTFLYNYVCGNHIVWGAEQVHELKIIHRLKAPERFRGEAIPMLNQFVENRTLTDSIAETVSSAMKQPVGTSLEEVLSWFASKPFSKPEVTAGFKTGQVEGDDVTTVWGMVQGMTAHARGLAHIDQRVDLERRAGRLLSPA